MRVILVSGNIDGISRGRETEWEMEWEEWDTDGRRKGEKEVYDVTTNS